MKDYIQPLLQELVPIGIGECGSYGAHSSGVPPLNSEYVELVELDLADQTPFVKNIRISSFPSGNDITSYPTATLVTNLDLGIMAPDSRILLKARLGGKWYRQQQNSQYYC